MGSCPDWGYVLVGAWPSGEFISSELSWWGVVPSAWGVNYPGGGLA